MPACCEEPMAKEETKVCVRCLNRYPLSQFHRNARSLDGHDSYCKHCKSELKRIWRAERELADAVADGIRRGRRGASGGRSKGKRKRE